jgi:hypothetical protein
MFFTFGKAKKLQILRCKEFAVDDYSFTLCALALKPSDSCNIEGYIRIGNVPTLSAIRSVAPGAFAGIEMFRIALTRKKKNDRRCI